MQSEYKKLEISTSRLQIKTEFKRGNIIFRPYTITTYMIRLISKITCLSVWFLRQIKLQQKIDSDILIKRKQTKISLSFINFIDIHIRLTENPDNQHIVKQIRH